MCIKSEFLKHGGGGGGGGGNPGAAGPEKLDFHMLKLTNAQSCSTDHKCDHIKTQNYYYTSEFKRTLITN